MWRYKWTNILDTISVDPLSTCHILLGWIQEIADVDCSGMEKGMRHSHSKYWTTLAGNIEILLVTATVSALGAPIPHSGIVFLPCLSSVFFLPSIVNWWSFWLGGGEVALHSSGSGSCCCLFTLWANCILGCLRSRGHRIYCNHARDLSLWLWPVLQLAKNEIPRSRKGAWNRRIAQLKCRNALRIKFKLIVRHL